MNVGVCRRLLGLIVCLGASLLVAAPAAAVQLDRSFGQAGLVDLRSEPVPKVIEYTDQFAVAKGGAVYLLQDRYPCTPWGRSCALSVSLARLRPNGERDLKYAGDGQLELPSVQGEWRGIAIDSRGGVLIGFHNGGGRVSVIRVDAGGALDRSFGAGGEVVLPCVCKEAEVQLLPQRSGSTLLAVLASGRGPGKRQYFGTVVARRLGPGGRVDRAYGGDGVATATVDNAGRPDHAVLLADGGLAFAGEGGYYGGGPWVGQIGPRGGFDRRSVRRTRAAMRAVLPDEGENDPFVRGIVPRPGGRLDLFGGSGGARGFILRLRPNGLPERSFGRGGLRLLPRPVVRVAATRSGRSFVLSPQLEREGWYAEYGLFSAWLDREGRVLEGFGDGGRRMRYASPFGQLAMQGERPLLLDPGYSDAGCRTYCPPSPTLYRFGSR